MITLVLLINAVHRRDCAIMLALVGAGLFALLQGD